MQRPSRDYSTQLDVRRMLVLREVALRGSITDAADALHFSASAVSQQVRVLEAEAGVALVERGPSSLRLTEAGRALVDHADFILSRLEEAEQDALAIAALKGGRLRMATFRTVGETLVAEAITYFGNRYPAVQLSLTEGEPEQYLRGLKAGQIDLALSFEYDFCPRPGDDTFESIELLTEPMVIALPTTHALAGASDLRLDQLRDETWIGSTPKSSVYAFTQRACAASGFEPQLRFHTDDYHVAQSLVGHGLGVAFIPLLVARSPHAGVVVRQVQERPTRRILVAHRPDGQRNPSVAAMVSTLQELARELDHDAHR